jgi:ribonuclease BN (tRNA processing enzyme)
MASARRSGEPAGKQVRMTTELVLLETAGGPMPVAGRAGISAALAVGDRVFVVDCGRGAPSAFAGAGLDFSRLEAVFLTHASPAAGRPAAA